MKHESLLRLNDTTLVIIDIQQKLLPAMNNPERVCKNAGILAAAANILKLPTIITEQYPKGLGNTIEEISAHLTDAAVIEKSSFSCARNEDFLSALKKNSRHQVLICGIEAHVCVLQTAFDLSVLGYQVHLAADAVSSRNPENITNALERMRRAGITISNTESALFEMLDDSAHENFREISKLIK